MMNIDEIETSTQTAAMKIERLLGAEWNRLKRIRIAALRDAPQAFGTTLQVALGWSDDVWRQQVKDLPTFVATIDATDVGIARGEAVAAWARDAGFKRLLLNVADDNSAAIALYERLNFWPTGETMGFLPPRSHMTEHGRARIL